MEIDIQKNKKEIVELLRTTDREGIEYLIRYMENNDFFKAPCSGQYHLCCIGGLAQHSLNVYAHIKKLADALCDETNRPSEDTLIIVSLLHDLGKVGDHGKPYYVENILKSGKKSDSKPFETNSSLLNVPHEIRSVIISERFIRLTEEEEHAILYHNGTYTGMGYEWKGKEQPLDLLLHWSDMWCSRVTEIEDKNDGNLESD